MGRQGHRQGQVHDRQVQVAPMPDKAMAKVKLMPDKAIAKVTLIVGEAMGKVTLMADEAMGSCALGRQNEGRGHSLFR